jgi:hypothetical protein
VVEVFCAYNFCHQLFIKYLPTSPMRHPANDMPNKDESQSSQSITNDKHSIKSHLHETYL